MAKWGDGKAKKVSDFACPPLTTPLHMRALEPRILLDAAAMETAMEAVTEAVHTSLADAYLTEHFPESIQPNSTEVNALIPLMETEPTFVVDPNDPLTSQPTEIAFVATGVPDILTLVAALPADVEVVLLNDASDELEQIAQALEGRSGVEAIHLISHGDQGILRLGDTKINVHSMTQVQRNQFASIGNALTDDGDILIYACDFAEGTEGLEAVDLLADLTRADIAASTDKTGHSNLGGDWDLEVATGTIEAEALDAGEAWIGSLPDTILEEYSPDIADRHDDEEISSTRSVGQTFRHNSADPTYELDKVEVVLRADAGAPPQAVRVTISETFGGPAVGTGTFPSTALSTTYDYYAITLDSVATLNDNQTYYLMVSTDDPSGTIETPAARVSNYSGGAYVNPDGSFKNDHDLYFKLIDSTNNAPDITSDGGGLTANISVDENQTAVTTIVVNDIDVPVDTITYSISGGFDAAAFTVDPNTGVLSLTNPPDYESPTDVFLGDNIYSLIVQASDGNGGTDAQTLFVTVNDVDEAPTGSAPPATTPEDTPINGAVTMADQDAGDTPEATLGAGPANGSVTVNLDGTYTYTPNPDYAGPDSFTVVVTDDTGLTGLVAVNVTVTPVNDAPTASAPAVTTPEDTQVSGTVIMADPDTGDTPEASLGTGPANGSVVLNLDGTFTYTPNANYVGADSFMVVVTDDGGLTANVTVNVTVTPVNDAPTGSAPSVTTPEDTPVNGTVTMADIDTGDTPEATLGAGPANGSVIVNLDGTYTYTPAPNYVGADSFTIVVTDDSGLTADVTVNVTVTPVNDAPTATAPPVTTHEDTPVNGTVTMVDIDTGDTPEATLGTGPANGSVVVNLDGTYTYTPALNYVGPDSFIVVVTDDAGLTDTVTVGVTVTPMNDAPTGSTAARFAPEDMQINGMVTMTDPDMGDTPEATLGTPPVNGSVVVNLDGTYTYTPNPDYAGPDGFTVIVTDDAGLTDTVTVNLTVVPVNDAPTGTASAVTTPEDTPVSGTVTMSDPDIGDTPEATLGTPPVNGSVVVNLDGTYTYTPNPDYAGPDGFTVIVTDDAGLTDTVTVNLTVVPVNDAPTGTASAVTTPEDTSINGTVTMADIDAGDTPEANLGTGPANGSAIVNLDGTYTYTPNPNYAGPDSFTVVVTDDAGLTDTVTVNVTVTPVNDAPTGSAPAETLPEDTSVSGTVMMDDLDAGDTPEATLGTGPSNGSAIVNLDGTFTYTPDPDYTGTDSFTVIITDDAGLTDTVTVNLTVTPVNDAPSGTALLVTTLEDTAVSGAVTMTDPDSGDTPEATLGIAPSNGVAVVNLDGTYTYTPNPNYAGPDSFTVIVTDDVGLTDAVTVNVAVTPVNDAPTASAPAVNTLEDTPVSGTFTMADIDVGDTPEATLGTGPSNGFVVVNLDGTYTYTPNPNYVGADSFTVIVTDDAGLTDTVAVNVTVTPVNDAPTATAHPVTTPEDTPVVGAVTMTDPDAGDLPEAILGTSPSNGSVLVNLDGTYTYAPNANYVGTDSFTVVVTDDAGLTDTVTVSVTVTPVNDAPVATGGAVAAPTDDRYVFDVADFAFTDEEGDPLQSITVSSLALDGGTLTHSGGSVAVTNGMTITVAQLADLTFTPGDNTTIASFDYTANDGSPGSVSASVAITVSQPSSPPIPTDTPNSSETPEELPLTVEPDEDETTPPLEPIELEGPGKPTTPPQLPQPSPSVPAVVQAPTPAPVQAVAEPLEPEVIEIVPSVPEARVEIMNEPISDFEPEEPAKPDYKFVPVNRQTFTQDLDKTGEEVREYGKFLGSDAAKVTFAFSSLVSVGGVSFALRGGLFAAALMSAAPAWGRYDPISIVAGRKDEKEEEEESQADAMLEFINDARSRVKKESFL